MNADCVNLGGGYDCECRAGFKREKIGDPVSGQCVRKSLREKVRHSSLLAVSPAHFSDAQWPRNSVHICCLEGNGVCVTSCVLLLRLDNFVHLLQRSVCIRLVRRRAT